jgi:two-component sensor histidine kinase
MQHLINSYNASSNIDFDVQVNDVSLDNDRVVILGLILNELISNSLQYAFPEGKKGKIKVHMNNTRSGVSLIIKDDGRGLPSGLNYKKTPSLGLQLVNTLVDPAWRYDKLKQNNGTEFDISFSSRRKFN